jgi:2-polyprenyl-3-methyl-5-hydroxy-6-metoxy-1,4-benzoquinol methylase
MKSLKTRSDEVEIMDDLNISGDVVPQTLKELNTINRLLGGNQISINSLKKMSRELNAFSLADLGCGGGDIMVQMARWARKHKIKAEFTGIDANPHIVEYAARHTHQYPEIRYETWNILEEPFQQQQYDIIHCCLFTHHFSQEQLVALFKSFRRQAKIGVIINDLHRHPLAYHSIRMLTSIFSQSEMVRNDACISVSRGFSRRELQYILSAAGIDRYTLHWKWAFRWSLCF